MHIKQHLTEKERIRGYVPQQKEFDQKKELFHMEFVKDKMSPDFARFTAKEMDGSGLLLMAEYKTGEDVIVGVMSPYDEVSALMFQPWIAPEKRVGPIGDALQQFKAQQADKKTRSVEDVFGTAKATITPSTPTDIPMKNPDGVTYRPEFKKRFVQAVHDRYDEIENCTFPAAVAYANEHFGSTVGLKGYMVWRSELTMKPTKVVKHGRKPGKQGSRRNPSDSIAKEKTVAERKGPDKEQKMNDSEMARQHAAMKRILLRKFTPEELLDMLLKELARG